MMHRRLLLFVLISGLASLFLVEARTATAQSSVGRKGTAESKPVLAGTLYTLSRLSKRPPADGALVAVDLATGHDKFTLDGDGYAQLSTDKKLLLVSDATSVRALDPGSGVERWRTNFSSNISDPLQRTSPTGIPSTFSADYQYAYAIKYPSYATNYIPPDGYTSQLEVFKISGSESASLLKSIPLRDVTPKIRNYCGFSRAQFLSPPSGDLIFLRCEDRVLHLNTRTQEIEHQQILPFATDKEWVHESAISPDGKRIYLMTTLGNLMLYDPYEKRVTLPIAPLTFQPGRDGHVASLAVSGDGKKLLILRLIESSPGVQVGSVLTTYDTATWRPVHLRGLPPLTSPVLDEGGDFVFALVYSSEHWMPLHTIICVDAASGRVVKRYVRRNEDLARIFIGPPRVPSQARRKPEPEAIGSVLSVAVSADGRYAISGHTDWTLKLWDLSSGVKIKTFEGHESWVTSVAFLPDGKRVLSASADNTLKLWNIATGREIRTFRGHTRVITCMALSPDGKYAVTGVLDHYPAVWELETGQLVRLYVGASGRCIDVAFTPDGRSVLWASEHSRDLSLRGIIATAPFKDYSDAGQSINALDISHGGKYFLTGGWSKDVVLWDMRTGHQIRVMRGHQGEVTSVIFSPDDKYAASGSSDNSIKLWEVETGREVRTFNGHAKRVNSLSFSPDGRLLLSAGADDVLNLWDVNTGKLIAGKLRVSN